MADQSSSNQAEGGPASFATPRVFVNSEGWGPTTLPEQYVGVPFTPFGKGDRLGRAADFVSQYRYGNRYGRDDQYYRNDEEDEFNLVDTSKTKARGGTFKSRWQQRNRLNQNRRRDQEQKPLLKGKQAKYLVQNTKRGKQWNRKGNNRRRPYNRNNQQTRDASVKVQANWEVIEQFDLAALTKMSMAPPPVTDLLWCGSVSKYNESYDRLSTKQTKKIERVDDVSFYYATTLDDPVIEKFVGDKVGNIFATDEIMAHLMSCTRSVLPWDLVFTRAGNMLFIDKRENSNLEMLTVNENAPVRTDDESKLAAYNTPEKLSIEATAINQSFQQQVLLKSKGAKKQFENPNPFFDEETEEGMRPADVAYRYRKWDLGDGKTLVGRSELHGVVERKGQEKFMTVYALNEWDSKLSGGVNWRQKIDSQRGAVLATELKNNAAKLGRWTAQSLVSGAELMKIGYVSRRNPRDPFKHEVLATQYYKPADFAQQINLSPNNMWGILKAIIELVMQQDKGKYVLLKDPNKPLVRLYKVPDDAFEEEEGSEDDEDEDELGA